ncbi:hypothetical protein IFO68_13395 [Photobacterium sp. CAU 1568]|uniref:Uncharacterized protein n=1 Tax=Photobacterium arenosum TaxID=2774143 RepID=A0ABR9BM80_9GAMM|nr:hypothetical protein [Photobacterium arenosum]MBD8513670.1 hypothetical protein [Photobacterium arenosum]
MLAKKFLESNYYIFSASFEKHLNKETALNEYPNWHNESDLRDVKELKSVRPLQLIPVISLSESEQPELWATDANYRLCSLRHGNQGKEGQADSNYSILAHSNPIHLLSNKSYNLKFPPLPMLAKLAQAGTSYESLCNSIREIADKIPGKTVNFKLTTISLDQLAEPFELDVNGQLINNQVDKNVAAVYLNSPLPEIRLTYYAHPQVDQPDDFFELSDTENEWSQKVYLRSCDFIDKKHRMIRFSGWPSEVKKVTLSRTNKGSEDFDEIEPVIIYKDVDITELLN